MSKTCLINNIKAKIKGNATSYIDQDNRIIIPVNKKFTLGSTFKIAQSKVNQINSDYNAKVFGNVVSIDTNYINGTIINIHPSQKLIEAYELKKANSDIETLFNTKPSEEIESSEEDIKYLNPELEYVEEYYEETFDLNIEENIITSEGDYMPNYESPVYQDNVEKELQQAQKDLDKEMITILEKDKQMEAKEDERPLEEESNQLEFDFKPTSSLETMWTSNQEKLISKFPEITYEDFVSLSNEERDNLLACL